MKKKIILAAAAVLAVAAFAGITVSGMKELGLIGNSNTQSWEYSSPTQTLYSNDAPIVAEQAAYLPEATQKAAVNNGIQEIFSQLEPDSYPALAVQKGIPVKWTITAEADSLNSCNNEIIIPALGISKPLQTGENIIEFTPSEEGILQYSCWMGMINSLIAVVDDVGGYDTAELEPLMAALPQNGGSCGMGGGGCCGGK